MFREFSGDEGTAGDGVGCVFREGSLVHSQKVSHSTHTHTHTHTTYIFKSLSGHESCANGVFSCGAPPEMCAGAHHTPHITGRITGEHCVHIQTNTCIYISNLQLIKNLCVLS